MLDPLFGCIVGNNLKLDVNVVSFNVGSLGDWQNLAAIYELQNEDPILNAYTPKTKQEIDNFKLRISAKTREIKDTFEQTHAQLVSVKLQHLIDQFQPAVFCLQEFQVEKSHQAITDILTRNGYVIAGEKDNCIAYKSEDYKKVNKGRQTFDSLKSPMKGKSSPGRYVDLIHKQSKTIIRVVSHHVQGFNAVKKKKHTEEKRKSLKEKTFLPLNAKERLARFISFFNSEHEDSAARGDAGLEHSLANIEKKSCKPYQLKSFINLKNPKPDLIIYGLDANATAKYVSEAKMDRLHPKRMQLFDLRNYQYDQQDKTPTILDWNDLHPRKYDYVCVKTHRAAAVAIESVCIPGLNNRELLYHPDQLMSDHLPVFAKISFVTTT